MRSRKILKLKFERNVERYAFLRWGQMAFDNFRLIPARRWHLSPGQSEYLAAGGIPRQEDGAHFAYPERWSAPTRIRRDQRSRRRRLGRRRYEAEAALLGQPIIMLIPEVIGFKLHGSCPRGRRRPTWF